MKPEPKVQAKYECEYCHDLFELKPGERPRRYHNRSCRDKANYYRNKEQQAYAAKDE